MRIGASVLTRACEMNSDARICVVGSANIDLTFWTPQFPQPGETLAGRALHQGMGGNRANLAVAAARLGASVALIAHVGNEVFGNTSVDAYQANDTQTSCIRQAVDTTGAGDAFTAALAVSLAESTSFVECAHRASAVAATSVTRIGSQPAFPTWSEVRQFLQPEENACEP